MIELMNLSGDILSIDCLDVSPVLYDSKQVKNRLLDGSYMIQIIGEPACYKEIKALVDLEMLDQLNLMQATCDLIKLIELGKFYIGYIDGEIQWTRLSTGYLDGNRRRYSGMIKLLIQEEGEVVI